MKRILFDLGCLPKDGSPGAGIAHAARELWQACLQEQKKVEIECVEFSSGTSRTLSLLRTIHKNKYQGFFASSGAIPLGITIPTFPWVHDVAIFKHPEWFPQSWLRRTFTTHLFLRGLKQARHIFCVSKDTQNAVCNLANVSQAYTSVTYEGVRPVSSIKKYHQRKDQVIMFGTVEPRKNIPFIVDLWPEVCRGLNRPIKLIIAGRTGWGKVTIERTELIDRIERVTDEERDALFSEARLVLVPSLHEGFGRVALEAMASGTPVIASRAGAHPEVIGDTGTLLDPQDAKGWIKAISELISSQEQWHEQQRRGIQQSEKFRWEIVARQILAEIAKNC